MIKKLKAWWLRRRLKKIVLPSVQDVRFRCTKNGWATCLYFFENECYFPKGVYKVSDKHLSEWISLIKSIGGYLIENDMEIECRCMVVDRPYGELFNVWAAELEYEHQKKFKENEQGNNI